MDADIDALKEKMDSGRYNTYQCRKCGELKDKYDFYIVNDRPHLDECVSCASNRHKVAAPEANYRTCRKCGYSGPEGDFHKTGKHGVTNVCKNCVRIKKETSKQRIEVPSHKISYPAGAVVLDFTEYPDILETIKVDARKNFRSINNEILFRIVNFISK